MSTLGVVIFSLQRMKHLSQCLDSVKWADAVTVFHIGEGEPPVEGLSHSSLTFRKIASKVEAKELSREIRTDWLLSLWGEERVEGDLREELRALCRERPSNDHIQYRVPVRSRVLGCWVEGSLLGPSPAIRLGRGIVEIMPGWWSSSERGVGAVKSLTRGWIGDYSAATLNNGVEQIQSISDLWVKQLQGGGQSLGPIATIRCSLQAFMRLLLMNGIIGQGLPALTISTLAAYTTLLTGAKIWEAGIAGSEE